MSATLNRPGQDNAAGDALANFKMLFSGMIAMHFQRGLKFADRITKIPFPKGRKSQELKFHDVETAVSHVPGENIFETAGYMGNPQKGSREVKLLNPIGKGGVLADIDAIMEDFDSKMFHAAAIREGLQRKYDQLCFRAIIAAAVRNGGAAEYTNEPDLGAAVGTQTLAIGTPGTPTTAEADILKDAIMVSAEAMDALDVPDEGRVLALRPYAYNLLFYTTNKDWLNRDYGNNVNGSTSERRIVRAAGMDVIRSNNIPTTDLSAEGLAQAELNRNFSNTVGAIFHKSAAVRADAREVTFDMWEEKAYRTKSAYWSDFIAAFGGYRRECAIWLKHV